MNLQCKGFQQITEISRIESVRIESDTLLLHGPGPVDMLIAMR